MQWKLQWLIKLTGAALVGLLTMGLLYQIYIEQNFQIYGSALRFHVRAASDQKEEQRLKLLVRDEVLAYIKETADHAKSAGQLKRELNGNLEGIANTAAQTLRKNGSGKEVTVSFTKERFPVRKYGGVIFPAGVYQALRVDIGEAKGHNWWCAIYPELCYNAEESPSLSEKGRDDIEENISGDERKVLLSEEHHFGFKVLEWFSALVP